MYGDRRSASYREGVRSFRDAAEANKHGGGFMFCPCVECRNEKDHTSSRVIQSHLLHSGFMSGYNVWMKHGERGVMMETAMKKRTMMTTVTSQNFNKERKRVSKMQI